MSHEESLTGSGRSRDSKLCSGQSQFLGLVSHLSMIISVQWERNRSGNQAGDGG